MKPEEKARKHIDNLLTAAGWQIQDYNKINLGVSLGVAVREFQLPSGSADYLLFLDGKAVGTIEAKPEGTTLGGVDTQSGKYIKNLPPNLPCYCKPLAFAYESTGVETLFRDLRDPYPRSRRIFAFHKPEILHKLILQNGTLRTRLSELPTLYTEGLRTCQIEAITNLEKSFAEARPRALIQMASGGGKTFTAVTECYRLIKFAKAERILFLVDRNNLGIQTSKEFQQYSVPNDGRKFTNIYNVQHLQSNKIDTVSKVCITTIQRLYSMLKGEQEYEPELEEHSMFENPSENKPKEINYNPSIPIETFDFIITDECHRSIYNLWRPVLEYFDAFIIGLTATPSKLTFGFFKQNLVTEYNHERAVADNVNVDYEMYKIRTHITEHGSTIPKGFVVDKRDRLTRKKRWEELDDEMNYSGKDLDRSVVAPDQIRTVIKTFRENLFTEIFPGRTEVPKTLIFAKDDSHADDIVHIVREVFGKGNEFCMKVTYRTTGEKPETLIKNFRNSYNPRIVVSVDMIATGTDIRPLECIIFMRDVKSRNYFEQMKGRGTRVINPSDLRGVTPDAVAKTHFIIVDAVGLSERDRTDSRPLERKRHISFEKLLQHVAQGEHTKDNISSLASRLSRLEKQIDESDIEEIEKATQGKSVRQMTNNLLDVLDPDKQFEKAQEMFSTESVTKEQIEKATEELAKQACSIFDDPDVRETLVKIKNQREQVIDTISQDSVSFVGFDEKGKEKAQSIIGNFKQFIEDNKDELTALQIIFSKPHSTKHVTFNQIKELAEAIKKPPYNLNSELVWKAYERLEKSKVKDASPQRLLTDIISLIRFTTGQSDILEPFSETVEQRFNNWLAEQQGSGREFTEEQTEWLNMIKDHIKTSLSIDMDDFEETPFNAKGGRYKVYQLFGNDLNNVLEELNEVLAA